MCPFGGGRTMRTFKRLRNCAAPLTRRRMAIFALAILGSSAPLQAIDYTWDGGGATNNWNDAANWNPSGAPTLTSTITFPTLGSSYTIAQTNSQFPKQDSGSVIINTTD